MSEVNRALSDTEKSRALFDSVFILAACMMCLTPILEYDAVAQVTLDLDLKRTTKDSRLSNLCDRSYEKIIDKCEF